MVKVISQALLILLLVAFCITSYLLATRFLNLSFRSTNDYLHNNNSPITLDFLIPKGIYIDEKMMIGDVMRISFKKEATFYEKTLMSLSSLIPIKYRYLSDTLLFIFWSFLYMTFLRIFTFTGYGRSLRISLLLGACTYYFMPDFTIGKRDDFLIIGTVLLIILIRMIFHRRKSKQLES